MKKLFKKFLNNFFKVTEFITELSTLTSSAQIREKMADPALANYIVCWFRLIASAELQRQPDFYINFLPDVASVADFCRQVY